MPRQPTFLALVAGLYIGITVSALAQTVNMTPIPASTLDVQVLGAERARPSDWPVTLVFSSARGPCTSTVVGQRVIITVAHCVDDGAPANAYLSDLEIHLTCRHHDEYAGPRCSTARTPQQVVGCTADVALCLADIAIPASVGKFERIKRTQPGPAVGQEVVILGYGCTEPAGPMSPTLQFGLSEVKELSEPGASSNPQNTYKEFIKTSSTVAACQGDSGGSAYSSLGPSGREIIGVVSRGNVSTDSYFVNVLDGHIAEFFRTFTRDNGVKICGLDDDASNCN